MARVRMKMGNDEIEIDSRDFYIDNGSAEDVLRRLAGVMRQNRAQEGIPARGSDPLESLDEAEVYEPEFDAPRGAGSALVERQLRRLLEESFFDSPRTVSETAERLRECGFAANLLDISKALAGMALRAEILRDSRGQRRHYFCEAALTAV